MGDEHHKSVNLTFRNIQAKLDGRQVIQNVSGKVSNGQMLAVMGPSGSGKTTLLNVLAGRIHDYTGDITINNQPITKQHRRRMGYALQQDIFIPTLTLRQTLRYTTLLRLPDAMPYDEKMTRCEAVAKSLDLDKCIDTNMGGVFVSGVSGGERKRATVACELLSDPTFMLIDEPTSGLDAALAFQVMSVLKSYATDQNKTIVTTIHQPSSQIFHMFETILLLADGQMAYYGNSRNIVPFFDAIGLHCDVSYNPADFMLDQVTKDEATKDRLIQATNTLSIKEGCQLERLRNPNDAPGTEAIEKDAKWVTGLWTQFKVLTERNLIQNAKGTLSIPVIVMVVTLSIATNLLWWKLPRTEENIESRKRLIFFAITQPATFSLYSTMRAFEPERAVINKERLSSSYRLSAYYISKIVSELPVVLVFPALYLTLIYFCVGLTIDASHFFITLVTCFVMAFTAQGLGVFVGSLFLDYTVAFTVADHCYKIMLIASGVLQKNFNRYLKWIQYIPFTTYGIDILLHTELKHGDPFLCSPMNESIFPECLEPNTTFISGQTVADRTDNLLPLWLDILASVGFVIIFWTLGYLVLRYLRHPAKHYNTPCSSSIRPRFRKLLKSRNKERSSTVIDVVNRRPTSGYFNLEFLNISATLGGKQILKNVSGTLKHGSMMAVLGPSGIGKTTLLNVLAGRIANYSGRMTVNDYPINKQIRRKMGYVMQQDIFFDNLTLKQTLQFVGQLRLPETLSSSEKCSRNETIISRFDLGNCADTKMAVLSGGEKKRANIACELLADPALLLVDEPTTGLDSSMAFEMMKTLQSFASESDKTILTTIHQPSSQIFHMFDKVLLLADGQVAFYGRPMEVVDHFNSIGLYCSSLYNPADFMLEQVRMGKDVTLRIIQAAEADGTNSDKENSMKLERKVSAKEEKISGDCNTLANNNGTEIINSSAVALRHEKVSKLQQMIDEENVVVSDKWPTRLWTQHKALNYRNFLESIGRLVSKTILISEVVLAVVCGLVWWQLPREENTIEDFKGLETFMLIHWASMYMIGAIFSSQSDRPVITKERLTGTYRLSAYWLAKMTSEIPVLLLQPTVNWTIVYFMVGLPLNIWTFMGTYLIQILTAIISQSVGLFFDIIFQDFTSVLNFCLTYYFVSLIGGGYYVASTKWYNKWIKYISMTYYPYCLFLQIVFASETRWRCGSASQTLFAQCRTQNETSGEDLYVSGHVVLDVTEPDILPVWINIAASVAFIVAFRLAGYLVLRFMRNPTKNGIK